MGIIPRGESPWGWAPTIRFWMAVDAINVSDTCYLTAVRYYLANLGTTMESQVTSSVAPLEVLSATIQVVANLFFFLSCASLCAAPLSPHPSIGTRLVTPFEHSRCPP